MKGRVIEGIAAGLLIAIGGCVFLACDVKYCGAFFFSVALLSICYKGYALFTGKVGFLALDHSKDYWEVVLTSLLGNAIATCGMGILIHYAMPHLGEAAYTICSAKLEQTLLSTVVRAILCGTLMYMAVWIFREKKSVTGVFLCVPVFILAGFEHSIANMFYFGASGIVSFEAFVYLMVVILGNAAGGVLFPLLDKAAAKSKEGTYAK